MLPQRTEMGFANEMLCVHFRCVAFIGTALFILQSCCEERGMPSGENHMPCCLDCIGVQGRETPTCRYAIAEK